MTKLEDGLAQLKITFSPEQIHAIETYVQAILKFNETYNLMKADTADELVVNHILDSLAPYATLSSMIDEIATQHDGMVLIGDIGSGGGCPGIPLATAFPNAKFILVERMEKRCDFLSMSIEQMGLKNVRVQCAQADKIAPQSFDIEVFRAFHPFDKDIARLLLRMLKPNGFIAAYKARSEKISAEMEAVQFLIPEYKKIALTVPFLEDHERNLIVIKKN